MVRFRALTPVVCPVVLLVVVIGFYWKLTLTNQYTWLDQPDTVYQVMPWLQAQAVEWHRGHFPLWDPHLWAGQPFIGQLQTGTLNPLNWLLFSMPLQHGFLSRGVLHWYFVLIHYVAALFAYLLCRDLRLSRTASLLAGSAFALGGFMGDCGWPQILCSAMWLPLVLMFYLRVLRDERPVANSAMCGSTFGMAFLSGHHNVPFFFAIVLSGLWLHFLLSSMKPDRARRALYCLVWGGCLSLIAAVQILPARELGIRSIRWVNAPAPVAWDQTVPYSVHAGLSLYPTAIIGMVIPGFESHTNPFIGLVVISLALFGIVTRWHEADCSVGPAVLHGIGQPRSRSSLRSPTVSRQGTQPEYGHCDISSWSGGIGGVWTGQLLPGAPGLAAMEPESALFFGRVGCAALRRADCADDGSAREGARVLLALVGRSGCSLAGRNLLWLGAGRVVAPVGPVAIAGAHAGGAEQRLNG